MRDFRDASSDVFERISWVGSTKLVRVMRHLREAAALVMAMLASWMLPTSQAACEERADAGTYPLDYDVKARAWLTEALKDPYSADIKEDRGPHLDYFQTSALASMFVGGGAHPEPIWEWRTCYKVNAKNSYGAYTGFRRHVVYYKHGVVTHSSSALSDVNAECSRAADVAPSLAEIEAVDAKKARSPTSELLDLIAEGKCSEAEGLARLANDARAAIQVTQLCKPTNTRPR